MRLRAPARTMRASQTAERTRLCSEWRRRARALARPASRRNWVCLSSKRSIDVMVCSTPRCTRESEEGRSKTTRRRQTPGSGTPGRTSERADRTLDNTSGSSESKKLPKWGSSGATLQERSGRHKQYEQREPMRVREQGRPYRFPGGQFAARVSNAAKNRYGPRESLGHLEVSQVVGEYK